MFFVIGVGYLDCNTVFLAVTFLTLQEGFTGAVRSGSQITRIDVAPRRVIQEGFTGAVRSGSQIARIDVAPR